MKQYQEIVPFFDATLDLREFSMLPRGELALMAYRLGELQRDHDALAEQLYRPIICGIAAPPLLVSHNSHKRCEFGRWYNTQASEKFANNPLFIELGELHQEIHRAATHLSKLTEEGSPIQNQDFDAFAQVRLAFRDKLLVLRDRLAGAWSFLDPLTGILRREAMQVILYQEQSRVERGQYQCCIAMVDIDHFKRVNDRYGHLAGDKTLQLVAQTLLKHSRAVDTLFRYGGEELLVCLPSSFPNESMQIMERLRRDIESQSTPIESNGTINVTISIGIAPLQAKVPIETIIAHADQALYQAKSEGRNRIVVYTATNQ